MSLKERLGRISETRTQSSDLLATYGVMRNPFPSTSQTSGHPRLTDSADSEIEKRLNDFLTNFTSQVVVVEGTQGTGKTNLLQYYEQELPTLDEGDGGVFVVHYYPDPEPVLDKLLARIVEDLGSDYLGRLINKLESLSKPEKDSAISDVRSPEFRQMLWKLCKQVNAPEFSGNCELAIEWLCGLRVYKRHRDALGVYQRLDTTESRIGALRDLITVSEKAKALHALFLLLDEIEKQQDISRSNIYITRYLASLRALIDAFPRRFFLFLAITPSARDTYRRYYPALASRIEGSVVQLKGIEELTPASNLYDFYLSSERQFAKLKSKAISDPFTRADLENIFKAAMYDAKSTGGKLTPRLWLQKLHEAFEQVVARATES